MIQGANASLFKEATLLHIHLSSDPQLKELPLTQEMLFYVLWAGDMALVVETDDLLGSVLLALRFSNRQDLDLSGIVDSTQRLWIQERALEIALFRERNASLVLQSIRQLPWVEKESIFILAATLGHKKVVESLLRWMDFDNEACLNAIDACRLSHPEIAAVISAGQPKSEEHFEDAVKSKNASNPARQLRDLLETTDDKKEYQIHDNPMPFYLRYPQAKPKVVPKIKLTIMENNSLFRLHAKL